MKKLTRIAAMLLAVGLPTFLLGYIARKILYILKHDLTGTHVGTDVIQGAYVLIVVGALACFAAPNRKLRTWLLALNVVATAIWLSFHLGGFIVSHQSMLE